MDGEGSVRGAIGLLLLAAIAGCGNALPRQSAPLASRIELAAGNVSVRQPGSPWGQAVAGRLLRDGAGVRVGPGDRALLRLADGGWAFLRHGTEVQVEAGGLRLLAGEAWVDVPLREREPALLRAGEVVVSASDAGLDLRWAAGVVEVFVARGLAVIAGRGGRAEIKQGERAVVAGAGRPEVAPVPFWEDWTGGMADRRLSPGLAGAASGRIYAVDRARPGAPAQVLEVRAQAVRAVIRNGVARTTVDQRFFNPGASPVEGYYWFTIPEGAAVDRFAIEVEGRLVEGEMVERQQAAAAYEAEVRSAIDPALLEWVDGRTFRCRIFPVPVRGERRVVLAYQELLPTVDGRMQYVYPLGSAGARIDELALEVDLGEAGRSLQLATTAEARIEEGGSRVSLRRSGYTPHADFLLEMAGVTAPPLQVVRAPGGRGRADYLMLRYSPDVPWTGGTRPGGEVALVVDTSAGGDEADRQLRVDAAEAILRALSTGDRFVVLVSDLKPRVLYPERGLALADEAHVGRALESLGALRTGGASDLGAMFDSALGRLHGSEQPALVYIGDGRPTVGELDGEALADHARRALSGSTARLFTLAVGGAADHALLERLAAIGGGSAYRIDLPEQATREALRFVGQLKTPTITALRVDAGAGLDQVYSTATGKISRGQEVVLLARTHHRLPAEITVSGRLGGKLWRQSYPITASASAPHVPALWARRQLDELLGTDRNKNRAAILQLGLEYGLMTPFSSFLVLENDEAYQRHGIQRRRRPVEGDSKVSALEAAAGVPLGLFGCSSEPPSRSVSLDVIEMESRSVRYAIRPAKQRHDEVPRWLARGPAKEGARAKAEDSARSAGVLGLLRGQNVADDRGVGGLAVGPDATGVLGSDAVDAMSGLIGASVGGSEDRADRDSRRARAASGEGCSDLASRPLVERRALWRVMLEGPTASEGLALLWTRAAAQCELHGWQDRRALLELLAPHVATGAQLQRLLGAVDVRSGEQLRRLLLRRALAPSLAMAAGEEPDWSLVEAGLPREPARRLAALRSICQKRPLSSQCLLRLVQALSTAGRTEEALAVAQRARGEGLATPALACAAGDLLAGRGEREQAMRTYSEIVEFAPLDPDGRQTLGDIFLRRGWYDEAHRQYLTLAELRPDDPLALLRLASAAAGAGRVDEALRLERRISGSDGEAGPNDPRLWARLASASRLARLLAAADHGGESLRQSLERNLRRLQVVPDHGTLVMLSWEDLQTRLRLELEGAPASHAALQRVDGGGVGIVALTSMGPMAGTPRVGRDAASAPGPVRYELITLDWNGRALRVMRRPGTLPAVEPHRPALAWASMALQ